MNNNKSKSGQTIVEYVVGGGILLAIIGAVLMFCVKYVVGNKQLVDFNQNFNVAYVLADDSKWEKHKIKAWKDWENSDAVQIIKEDGNALYTHLMNVKLVKE